jgi:hypothetical protein
MPPPARLRNSLEPLLFCDCSDVTDGDDLRDVPRAESRIIGLSDEESWGQSTKIEVRLANGSIVYAEG